MRLKIVFVALLTFVAALLIGSSASATSEQSPEIPVGTQGVGIISGVNQHATLYQCPDPQCNKGTADPGQALSALCYWPNDNQWNWVVNHTNGHTGYVRSEFLTKQAHISCSAYGRGTRLNVYWALLYQCPFNFCNKGEAYSSHDLATVCVWLVDREMNLVHNHTNGHVGFIDKILLTNPSPTSCRPN